MISSDWEHKRVLVMGLGIQGGGVGVAQYFAEHDAHVIVTDLKSEQELTSSIERLKAYTNITFHLGGHYENDFTQVDYVIKGPSIRWDNPHIQKSRVAGIPVIMETAYFVKHTKAKVVGVTGTRGKSTTTACIYETLKRFYKTGNVYIAGNVPGTCAIQLLDKANPEDIVVLELSSWQLSGFHKAKVSPRVAVFTTIYEDHMNYYNELREYIYDKAAICLYQKPEDYFITYTKTWETLQSHSIETKALVSVCSGQDFPIDMRYLKGEHNKLNAALALAACERILPQEKRKDLAFCISAFEGLYFRQENIGIYGNITIINDSTSTTPISVITALRTFKKDNIILILGGSSKKLSFEELIRMVQDVGSSIKYIVLLKGSMTEEMLPRLSQLEGISVSDIYEDFSQAIENAVEVAQSFHEPVTILFSPGAPSFAQFKNEFDRGEQFNHIISAIMKE